MALFWFSFCDPNRPSGSQFLGACVIEGDDFASAIQNSHAAGCNPGGEIEAYPIAEALTSRFPLDRRGVLWTRAECEAFDEKWRPS